MEGTEETKQADITSLARNANQDGFKKLTDEVEESIIRALSDNRKEQLKCLKEMNQRRNEEINIKKIPMKIDSDSHGSVDMVKKPNFAKEANLMNFKDLQNFRNIIDKHYGELSQKFSNSKDTDEFVLTEINLVSLFFYCFHLVEPTYVPYLMKTVVEALNKRVEPDLNNINEENVSMELFKLLHTLQFEKAYELLSSFEKSADVYEEIGNIIHPIKQYFTNGFTQSYQNYEVEQMFNNMTVRAKHSYDLYSHIENLAEKPEIKRILPCLKLLSGDLEATIDDKKTEILHDLCLRYIYTRAIPNEENKQEWKNELLEQVAQLTDKDQKEFHIEFLDIILDDPYQKFDDIKGRYPAWLSEFLLYLWDTNGILNEEPFRECVNLDMKDDCTIIEAGTEEYVKYIISLELKDSINICDPYLRLLDDEGIVECLAALSKFDYSPGDQNSYLAYRKIYEREYKSREIEELKTHYEETIVDGRAKHFQDQDKGKEARANFYEVLKHFSERRSLQKFNMEIIRRLNEIFQKNIDPSDLIDEEMPEFSVWRKRSEPFNFLATYCDLFSALRTTKDNYSINESLREIFGMIESPIQYKILVIHMVSNYLLHEEINVDQAIIMEMMTLFEQFDSKDPMLTDKYFLNPLQPLNSQDKLLIRNALKDSLTCGLIRG